MFNTMVSKEGKVVFNIPLSSLKPCNMDEKEDQSTQKPDTDKTEQSAKIEFEVVEDQPEEVSEITIIDSIEESKVYTASDIVLGLHKDDKPEKEYYVERDYGSTDIDPEVLKKFEKDRMTIKSQFNKTFPNEKNINIDSLLSYLNISTLPPNEFKQIILFRIKFVKTMSVKLLGADFRFNTDIGKLVQEYLELCKMAIFFGTFDEKEFISVLKEFKSLSTEDILKHI